MRYILILSTILSLADTTIALPARAGLLEIRSIPVTRSKPILRWWERIDVRVKEQMIESPLSLVLPTALIGSASFVLGIMYLPDDAFMVLVFTPLAFHVGSKLKADLVEVYREYMKDRGESSASKLRGKHIYYTEQRDGIETLCRGCVVEASRHETKVKVATTDGEESLVPINDIIGISVPNHPDLHKRVMLLTEADDNDYFRLIGKVSEVYDTGSYEIEVDHKVDYDLNEFAVDESHTIFVHASLPENEGGFVFRDGRTAELHETIQLAAAAKQADRRAPEGRSDDAATAPAHTKKRSLQ